MRALLIANPNSTTLNARVQRTIVQTLMSIPELQIRAEFTHYSKHAQELVAGITRADYEVLVVLGGDGTVNEVINGLLGTVGSQPAAEELPRLLFIPTGSANVFARALGFPQDPEEAVALAKDLIIEDQTQLIDVGTWGEHWFVANAGVGIDADVIAAMERVRAKGEKATPLRYLSFGLNSWRKIRRHTPQISFTAEDRSGKQVTHDNVPLCFITNTNPWTFFGPVPVITNPQNSLRRGLGVYALRSLRGFSGVLAMANLVGLGQSPSAQERVAKRRIRFDDAAWVRIACDSPLKFQVDGEYVGEETEMTFGAVSEALNVYAPKKPQGRDAVSSLKALRNFLRLPAS